AALFVCVCVCAAAAPAHPAAGRARGPPNGRAPKLHGAWREERLAAPAPDGKGEARGRMLVYLPAGYDKERPAPFVLLLHGWSHSPEVWRDRTRVADWADRVGAALVAPDMGTTVYESAFYPETTRRWKNGAPGTRWIEEVVLPEARRRFSLANDPGRVAVVGYSTGARGAVVLAARRTDYGFVGALSGTYDLAALDSASGEARIHAVVFGPRERFAARWRGEGGDPLELAAALQGVEVRLGHGADDKVVPPAQTRALADALALLGRPATVAIVPGAGHDWTFWNAQLKPLLAALERRWQATTSDR
ncbi:MAG: alpha/beta hydrolase-fold protein, partial [Candidatus Polarisedimenticolia bacterium]